MNKSWRFFFRNASLARMLLMYIPASLFLGLALPIVQPSSQDKIADSLGFIAILCFVVKLEAIIIRMKLSRGEKLKDVDRESL